MRYRTKHTPLCCVFSDNEWEDGSCVPGHPSRDSLVHRGSRAEWGPTVSLAIYCFAWQEGGAENKKLAFQEKVGRKYALWSGWASKDYEVYKDTTAEIKWERRPEYERMIQDIGDGKVQDVWSLGEVRLNPFNCDEGETFQCLCEAKGVRVTFARSGLGPEDFGIGKLGRRRSA